MMRHHSVRSLAMRRALRAESRHKDGGGSRRHPAHTSHVTCRQKCAVISEKRLLHGRFCLHFRKRAHAYLVDFYRLLTTFLFILAVNIWRLLSRNMHTPQFFVEHKKRKAVLLVYLMWITNSTTACFFFFWSSKIYNDYYDHYLISYYHGTFFPPSRKQRNEPQLIMTSITGTFSHWNHISSLKQSSNIYLFIYFLQSSTSCIQQLIWVIMHKKYLPFTTHNKKWLWSSFFFFS